MKFGIISDLHMEFSQWDMVDYEVNQTRRFFNEVQIDPDAFYLNAGDTQSHRNERLRWLEMFDGKMFTVMGNHDFYINDFDPIDIIPDPIDVGGLRIAGATLWTDLGNWNDWVMYCQGLVDIRYIVGLTYDSYNAAHRLHRDYLLGSKADIIVSHHLPSYRSVHEKYRGSPYNPGFATELEAFISDMSKPPLLWVHGHTHMPFDYHIGKTRVICHPRGYTHERETWEGYSPKYVEL